MGLKVCFHCEQDIELEQDKFMLGLEKPYVNLWFHRACYSLIKNDLESYLKERYEDINAYDEQKRKKNSGLDRKKV